MATPGKPESVPPSLILKIANPTLSSATYRKVPERSVAIPTGECKTATPPKLPMLLRLPSALTEEELILLLDWAPSKRSVLSGLSRTVFASVPGALKGLAIMGDKTPVAATVQASVMVEAAKEGSVPYR